MLLFKMIILSTNACKQLFILKELVNLGLDLMFFSIFPKTLQQMNIVEVQQPQIY